MHCLFMDKPYGMRRSGHKLAPSEVQPHENLPSRVAALVLCLKSCQ